MPEYQEHQLLPANIEVMDFSYNQVHRDGDLAIYKVTTKFEHSKNDRPFYEVIRVVHQKESFRFGKHYPAKEAYPGNELFGKYGWTVHTIERAMEKLEEVKEKLKENAEKCLTRGE